MNRNSIADHVVAKLTESCERLRSDYIASGKVSHFYIDGVLPELIAESIRAAFPEGHNMRTRSNLRELKHVAAQMNKYNPILEETLFAFQDQRIISLIEVITGLKPLQPDKLLYAGGISMMSKGHFLNPHLDNSHDKDREMYRVLNLLYYVSPDWSFEKGGNLELWPNGVEGEPTTIESRFNRLVVMVTHRQSWHSVSPVQVNEMRCCVSNYYFSHLPAEEKGYFHITSFRGRPEQPMRDLILRVDAAIRGIVRKAFPKGLVETKHYYKNDKQNADITKGTKRR